MTPNIQIHFDFLFPIKSGRNATPSALRGATQRAARGARRDAARGVTQDAARGARRDATQEVTHDAARDGERNPIFLGGEEKSLPLALIFFFFLKILMITDFTIFHGT